MKNEITEALLEICKTIQSCPKVLNKRTNTVQITVSRNLLSMLNTTVLIAEESKNVQS